MEHVAALPSGTRPEKKLEGGKKLVMHTPFKPAGDQPTAIAELVAGVQDGEQNQVLLGGVLPLGREETPHHLGCRYGWPRTNHRGAPNQYRLGPKFVG